MVRKDGTWVKIQRLAQIAQFIAKAMGEGKVEIEKTLVWIQYEMGLTEQKAREYLGLVMIKHGWINNDGIIQS